MVNSYIGKYTRLSREKDGFNSRIHRQGVKQPAWMVVAIKLAIMPEVVMNGWHLRWIGFDSLRTDCVFNLIETVVSTSSL